MSEFGNFCLLLALTLSLYALFASVLGALHRQDRIVRSAEHAALAAGASITLAMASLALLFLTDSFNVAEVASSSNRTLPLYYKIAAIWGGHNGSMLMWVFFASIFSGLVIYQYRYRYRDMMPYVVAVLMVNLSFFLALNIFVSNPFNELMQISPDGSMQAFLPADGRGLNPLLQHWAMVIHPPILYIGFIGFVVPFAFAIAALITRQRGDSWIRTTRRWTLATWLFLGAGLMLGAMWAYVELGWGGYWGWDPVENSSLMPWLIGTAFLHSVIVQERKGMMKVWNVLLVVLVYLLGVFGTFLTRSGVVSSVHAFADSSLGKFFVLYMLSVAGASLFLILKRLDYLKSERPMDSFLSRESAFLFANLILVVAALAIFWGTMFPVFSEAFGGKKITVGPPFFNSVNVPIGLFLLLLIGVGPLFAWRRTSVESLRKAFLWPLVLAAATAGALLAGGLRDLYPILSLSLAAFVLVTIAAEFYRGARVRARNTGSGLLASVGGLFVKNKRRYGGYVVHLGVVLIFIGLTGNAFNREVTAQLAPGQEMKIGDYTLKMKGYNEGRTTNYIYGRVTLDAYRSGKLVVAMEPEKRLYQAGQQQMTTEVALHSTPREDLYVVFSGGSAGGKYEITAHLNPLVWWLWAGSVILVLGTMITMLPERRSLPVRDLLGRRGETVEARQPAV